MDQQINWGDLFEEWVRGDEAKEQFLARKGLDPADEAVKQNTGDWEGVKSALPAEVRNAGLTEDLWQLVQDWRAKQAGEDYKSADILRLHTKALLQAKLKQTVGPDGKPKVETTLNPSQLRSLADTLDKVQKTQRLALGMSTDNIGVDVPQRGAVPAKTTAKAEVVSNIYPIKGTNPLRAKKLTKLEKLNCWDEVHNKILQGVRVWDIVRFIQVEKGEYTEITAEGLKATIYQWIAKHREDDDGMDERIPTKHLEMIGASGERVDPLDAINMLFAIHMDRVLLDYDIEKRNKRCLDNNTKALTLANEMVKTISSLENDVLRRRLITSEPKNANDTMDQLDRVRKSLEERWGRTAASVALNDESRRRVFNALEKVRRGNTESMVALLKINDERAKMLKSKGTT